MSALNEEVVNNTESGSSSRLSRFFVLSAGAILVLTGLAKLWSAFGHARILDVPTPILGISFSHSMLAVGVLELLIASSCLLGTGRKVSLALIAWLATNFLVYRLGLLWVGYHKPCSCLGNLTDALHISPQAADTAMKIVLAYLLLGSYGCLLWRWRDNRRVRLSLVSKL